MDVKGANPFLFTEDDYASPNSGNSNPFLIAGDDFMDESGGNDNPFLSQSAATVAPSATATNPFAFDPMDLEPSEAQSADIATSYPDTFNTNTFMQATQQESADIFTQANAVTQDFLIDTNVSIPSIVPQKPTDLDLKYTHTVAHDYDNGSIGLPKRPPPPRPPPSKETQDLLMSVMGEMDATSSHLLDRIPPTRTPSPVSMRDLHSPSPTPEPQFGDLLDVSDAKTDTTVHHNLPNQQEDLFMSLTEDTCDINQNPPALEQPMQPVMQHPSVMQQQQPHPMMQQQQPRPMMPQHQPQPMMPQHQSQPMMQQHESQTMMPQHQSQPMMPQHPSQPMMPQHQSQPMMQNQPPEVHPQTMMQNQHVVKPQPMMQQQQPVAPPQSMMQHPPLHQQHHEQQPVVPPQPMMQQPPPQQQVVQPRPQPPPQPSMPPARPGPPVRPPRPQPPQKPPPPAFAQPPAPQAAAPPPKPPPPVPQPPASAQQPAQQDEFMDMFGAQMQAPKTTADIMNLYKTKQEAPVDLLSDSLESAVPAEVVQTSVSESNSRKSSVPSSDNTVISASIGTDAQNVVNDNASISPQNTQENFLSPQQDMQMDTSDSQSKESVSSVTFNPFAAVEETSPTNPSVIPSQDFGNNLDNEAFHEDTLEEHGGEISEITTTDHFSQYPQDTTSNMFGNVNDNAFEPKTISSIFGINDNVFVEDTSSTMYGGTTTNACAEPMSGITTTTISDMFGSSDTGMTTPFPTAAPNTPFETTETDNFNIGANAFSGFDSREPDAFDAFAAKFESARDENKNGAFDAFGGGGGGDAFGGSGSDAFGGGGGDAFGGGGETFVGGGGDSWGNQPMSGFSDQTGGFGAEEPFDSFLAMKEPPAVPQSTPSRINKAGSLDSDEEKDFSVVIRPKSNDDSFGGALPVLAPPPVPTSVAFSDNSRINPFDQSEFAAPALAAQDFSLPMGEMKRTDSQETPPTPLFDDDVSQPLEPFPRVDYPGEGWEMHLRQPNKKKITGQRFWKKIFVRLVYQQDCVLLQLYNLPSDKDPFQELPLQPCYSVSDIGAQQYDNFGKIFTLKLQYIFYKERPGVRPGQVKKAERITNKLSQFAAYAIQGDYQGCKEFGSDLKKLGLPVEHAPQVSQLMKLGSLNFEDLKQFSVTIEEALFKLQAHRDRALHYKMEEVQVTAVDELYVEQDCEGHVEKQIARVRLFFLGFLTGMPDIELGVNDMRRQGREVVGRHDIIPVVTEEWIRLENVEFHSCVQQVEYNETHIIKFKPPDACYIELLRFRVRPPKNRELPLQLKAQICQTGTKIELRADVLVPGFASRKLGQVPCEDVMIRFPIPECWIYMFRVEKHFRYGSVKSAHRRTGKIKGIERILGTVDTLQESLIEVTSGQAKYEHQHRAIVWRCPRLPKEGQGAYTTHNMVCRLSLTSYDQMPESLAEYAYVEFTMPATQVSHTTVRSVSLQNSDSDEPPEKYVRYLARHEYRVGIEHTEGDGPAAYVTATQVSKPPPPAQEEKPKPIPEAESSSDSD